ncbi:MAG: hypothetical protein EBQ96_05710 [Proteobacteria bacterium]|nr:hypothetical protein [Pseudomonadota bacterium]
MPVFRPENLHASYAPGQENVAVNTGLGPEAPGFKDLIDVINPLQHIPIVSTVYREMTGDDISSVARVIGGTVFGGPVGGALALADVAIKEQTGSTVGEKALNLVSLNTKNDSASDRDPITLGKRKTETARMAGSIPVWNGKASPSTQFETMIAGLSDKNNHIS